ncbi:MAG TPA: tyrosine-type recombinase/integrase [Lentimicrobium sp.]|nr:tyrosine-type recombinase/integrase [Lentimicrobium sp.]
MIRETFFDYLKLAKRYSLHTLNAYRTDLHQFESYCNDTYGFQSDEEVTYAVVRSWMAFLVDAGLSPRSINRKLSSLQVYFRYLLRENHIRVNPLHKAVSLGTPSRLPVFVSKREMKGLIERGEEKTGFSERRDLLVIEILYSTGIRLSELINLKLTDLDKYNLTLKVTGKRNKQRIIPVSKILMDLIDEYLEHRISIAEAGVGELIVTDSGRKAYPVFIYRLVERCLAEAGVKGRRSPHVLRHTFATHLLNEGADLNAIKELLGHSSLAATQVYTHISVEKLKTIYKLAHPRA